MRFGESLEVGTSMNVGYAHLSAQLKVPKLLAMSHERTCMGPGSPPTMPSRCVLDLEHTPGLSPFTWAAPTRPNAMSLRMRRLQVCPESPYSRLWKFS